MADPRVDEGLKAARLAYQVLIGFVISAMSVLIPRVMFDTPNWPAEKRVLEKHLETAKAKIEDELRSSLKDARADETLKPDDACLAVDGRVWTYSAWKVVATTSHMRVGEVQALRSVELLELPHDFRGWLIELDCSAKIAWVTVDGEAPTRIELRARVLPLDNSRLTVMNAYADYEVVENAVIDDMLEVVRRRAIQSRRESESSLPIAVVSLNFISLTLIALVMHLTLFMNRLREMTRHHGRQMLAFAWIVTMNSPTARWLGNIFTLFTSGALLVFVLYDRVKRTVPWSAKYVEPSMFELVLVSIAALTVIWMMVVHVRLQCALPPNPDLFEPSPSRDGNLPICRVDLIGRDKDLRGLGNPLRSFVVLTGAEGVGKTALACEFAYKHRAEWLDGIFVIDCASSVVQGLSELAPIVLQSPLGNWTTEDRALAVLHALASRDCLLLYDDVGAPEQLLPWLPTEGHSCRVLVTSRCPRWPEPFEPVTVEALPIEHVELLWTRAKMPAAAVAEIHRRSGGNPGSVMAEIDRWTEVTRAFTVAPEWVQSAIATPTLERMPSSVEEYFDSISLEPSRRENVVEFCRTHGLDLLHPDSVFVAWVASNPALVTQPHDAPGRSDSIVERTKPETSAARSIQA